MPYARKIIQIKNYPVYDLLVDIQLDYHIYFPGSGVYTKILVANVDGAPFANVPEISYSITFEDGTLTESGLETTKEGEGFFDFTIPESTNLLIVPLTVTATVDGKTQEMITMINI